MRPEPRPGFLCAVSKLRGFVKYWLPILLWLALIFTASSDEQSAERSSRIIGPLVHWLFPHLSEGKVQDVVTVVRKWAHVTEYAVLTWLFWRAVRKPVRAEPRPWNWREAGMVLVCVALFAISDEIHQAFVPTRQASPWDVMIDATGAVLGLLAIWLVCRWRMRYRKKDICLP